MQKTFTQWAFVVTMSPLVARRIFVQEASVEVSSPRAWNTSLIDLSNQVQTDLL